MMKTIAGYPVPDFVYNIYLWVLKIVFVVLIFFVGYGIGQYKESKDAEQAMQTAIAKENEKYNELLLKKNKVTEKVVVQYVDKIVEITKWRTKNVEIAKTVPDTCVLSNGWVSVHDASAQGRPADAAGAADETSSGITAPEALAGVSENYAICRGNREQIIGLQNYIKEQQKLIDEFNKK
jgi:hypothetical protein